MTALTLEPLELLGHAPAAQRHRVLVTFPTLAAANVALAPGYVLSYASGGVVARRVMGRAADRSVLVTSAPRYSGADGADVMSGDVARVLATLERRGAMVNGGRP